MENLVQVRRKMKCRQKTEGGILRCNLNEEKRKQWANKVNPKGGPWRCGIENWVKKWPKYRQDKLTGLGDKICLRKIFLVIADFYLD